jgi:copper chaperone CopZ
MIVKTLLMLLSIIFFNTSIFAIDSHKEGGSNHDEITKNGLSSGQTTNNFININVNGMVCDFCAQSIEKVFMKRIEVKGIDVNLEDQKVVIYLGNNTNIADATISNIFEDAGYTVEKITRNS